MKLHLHYITSITLKNQPFPQYINPSSLSSSHPSIRPSVCHVSWSFLPFIHLAIHLSISILTSFLPSIHTSVHPFVHPFVHPSLHPSIHTLIIHTIIHSSFYLSIYPSIHLSIFPSIHPPSQIMCSSKDHVKCLYYWSCASIFYRWYLWIVVKWTEMWLTLKNILMCILQYSQWLQSCEGSCFQFFNLILWQISEDEKFC